MIRSAFRVMAIAAAVASVNAVRPAAAEPVNILGGVIDYSRQNQADMNLTIVDGWIRGNFGDGVAESWDPPSACFPCTPGSTMNLSVSENMPKSDPVGVGGVLFFRGVEYFISSLSFRIDSESVTLPASFSGSSTAAQFALHGLVEAWTRDHFSGVGLSLVGYGKASMFVLGDNNWFSTTYRFENPAAVPEPGTLLLFATGAAGAVARRWRKRQASV